MYNNIYLLHNFYNICCKFSAKENDQLPNETQYFEFNNLPVVEGIYILVKIIKSSYNSVNDAFILNISGSTISSQDISRENNFNILKDILFEHVRTCICAHITLIF